MLVGRDTELGLIRQLLDAAAGGSGGGLAICGEAGIGKTRLLDEADRLAEGFDVLRAAGFEAEAELPYAAAHQLVQPLLGTIDTLPGPQAAAVRRAFGIESGEAPSRLLVGLAVLTLLASAAERRPLLCLVDDAQWTDHESLDALVFVARRIRGERVALIVAARDGARSDEIVRVVRGVRPAPLRRDDARRLLVAHYRDQLGREADRLLERAAGNPLALLELGAAATAGRETVSTVEQAYLDAIRGLPSETQTLLLLAAADDPAPLATVIRAGRVLGADIEALEPAELSGLVAVGEAVRFKHPLLRSAAYVSGTFEQRRRAHLALADALDGQRQAGRRTWHRAAATVGPDEAVAAELEEWALRASERSGYAAAASALERAAQLSPSDRDRARRLVEAAEAAVAAGQREKALELVEAADGLDVSELLGARAARVRGLLEAQHGSPSAATRIFLDAASRAYPHDRSLTLDVVTLAQEAAGLAGAIDDVVELGRWADRLGTGETAGEQIMLELVAGFAAISRGDRAAAAPRLARAVELGRDVDEPRLLVWAGTAAMFLGDDAALVELLPRAVTEARARGALGVLPFALHLLAGVERRLGNISVAEADADESLRLARESGQEVVAAGALSTLTALAAFRGDVERARQLAAETRALAAPRGLVVTLVGVARALADVDLARGRPADALAGLDAVIGRGPKLINAPFTLFTSPLIVEASVRAGEPARASERLAAFEEWAEAGGLEWAQSLIARCHALIASSDEEADYWFQRAIELHGTHPDSHELARTQLLYGEFLRRARRKTEARSHLRSAAEGFEVLGAGLWEARARAELRATGATARKREESTRADLTPQELQIVRLVALGKTNPEVASELFLSPKTVQYHLRKVFVKLGIASRTQLTRLVAQGRIPGAVESADRAAVAAHD